MSVEVVEGDILTYAPKNYKIFICHQVNCGVHAGGLAGKIFDKYPEANTKKLDKTQRVEGLYNLERTSDGKVIVNLFGQKTGGAPTKDETKEMRLEWMNEALTSLAEAIISQKNPLLKQERKPFLFLFPYGMGSGIAGGDWDDYYNLIDSFFNNTGNIDVKIVKLSSKKPTLINKPVSINKPTSINKPVSIRKKSLSQEEESEEEEEETLQKQVTKRAIPTLKTTKIPVAKSAKPKKLPTPEKIAKKSYFELEQERKFITLIKWEKFNQNSVERMSEEMEEEEVTATFEDFGIVNIYLDTIYNFLLSSQNVYSMIRKLDGTIKDRNMVNACKQEVVDLQSSNLGDNPELELMKIVFKNDIESPIAKMILQIKGDVNIATLNSTYPDLELLYKKGLQYSRL